MTGINVTGIEDIDEIRNALEITGIVLIYSDKIFIVTKKYQTYCDLEAIIIANIYLKLQSNNDYLLKSGNMHR